jgi:3-phosphoshikimate 1-carboxyvinyltransferase
MPLLAKPIKYHLSVPGSKSLMNRALLCAALATGRSVLQDVIYCEDTVYMLDALKALGIRIRRYPNHVVVFGNGGRFVLPRKPIYIGNAGTVRRFFGAISTDWHISR